jgi:hypothetical protein
MALECSSAIFFQRISATAVFDILASKGIAVKIL